MHGYYLPADGVSFQEANLWYTTSRTRNTDRDLEVQNSQFVMDRYGRRMTSMSQSPSPEKTRPSRVVIQGLAPLRLVVRGGASSDRANNTMADPHTPTQDGDGLRSNSVRLSRRTAIRTSTRNRNTTTAERRDSKLHTRFPVTTSFHTIAQPTPQSSNRPRRFSFEEDPVALSFVLAGRVETTGPSTALVSEHHTSIPTPTPRPHVSSTTPTLETQHRRQASPDFSSRPRPSLAEELQAVGEKTPEREDEEVVQRRTPTTFEEILGERKIPTALL
jgi:hypothetical protein